MKIIKQSWEWHTKPIPYKDAVFSIAKASRNCYQSELKSLEEEENFIRNLIKRGHHSPLEHVSFSFKLITNREVTHELVRHRLASFCQESQRYVKYKEIQFIEPVWAGEEGLFADDIWLKSCSESENSYKGLLDVGLQPQQARAVLNNSTKTSIVMTCNLRELRHILKLRTAKDAHPQMINLMSSILETLKKKYPVFFEDL